MTMKEGWGRLGSSRDLQSTQWNNSGNPLANPPQLRFARSYPVQNEEATRNTMTFPVFFAEKVTIPEMIERAAKEDFPEWLLRFAA